VQRLGHSPSVIRLRQGYGGCHLPAGGEDLLLIEPDRFAERNHANRHCEKRSDAAIQSVLPPSSVLAALDCHAALAMTWNYRHPSPSGLPAAMTMLPKSGNGL